MTEVYAGQILGGKYRVDRVLGAGGMGMVVAATHLQLDERIAIKFLLPEALRNPEAVARFGREAKAAVKIRGEHVARVIDVGTFENGAPYMVMEHLDGRDLSTLIHERGALPPIDAVDAVLQACEALAEAHALGIIHRDLKPANLFMVRRPDGTPSVKVLDFGISKLTAAGADHSMTKTSAVMGSPLYMSPEQMTASRHVDARTDIWAIGVVLFELLTGRVPFSAETLPEICGLILTAAPPAIRDFSPAVPDGLQEVVRRCLEKDRDRRFANVSELANALSPFGSRATSRSVERIARILGASSMLDAMPLSGPAPAPGNFGPSTQSNWGQTKPSRSSAMPLLAGAGALVVLLGAGAAFLLLRGKPEVAPAASGQPVLVETIPSAAAPAPVAAPAPIVSSSPVVPAPAPSAAPSPAAISPKALLPAKPPPPKPAAAVTPPPAVTPQAVPAPAKAKRSTDDLLSGRN
ncbi:MAG TPA: serine/threonine-protein kinase [Polyangiaceae bacterium]|jgi:serine/threonine-protein kinase